MGLLSSLAFRIILYCLNGAAQLPVAICRASNAVKLYLLLINKLFWLFCCQTLAKKQQ